MLLSYICFKILGQKNLIKSKVVKNEMFMRKYIPNKHTGKSIAQNAATYPGLFKTYQW